MILQLKIFGALLGAFAILAWIPNQGIAAASPPLLLDARQVLERIESSNLQVLLNREGVEEALQVYRQRRAEMLPTVDLNVSQTRNQFVNVGRGFDVPGATPRTAPSNRFDARLVGNISLVDTERYASWRLARLGHQISELRYREIVQELMEAGLVAFLSHRRNLASMDVIEANIARNQSLLDLARDRFNAGVATEIDVTRAEVALANSQQSRLQQETLVFDSELRLKRLLNLGLDREIRVPPLVDEDIRLELRPEERADPGRLLGARYDYQEAVQQQEQNRLVRRAADWQRLPDVAVFGEWGYAGSDAFQGSYRDSWALGVRLQVPIFEGFRIQARKLQADSLIRAQEYRLQNLEEEILASYRLQWKDVQSRYDQLAVAGKTLDLNLRELQLARTRFEQGVADNREVVDAQNALANAEDNLVESIFRFELARLALARIAGDVRQVLDEGEGPLGLSE